MVSILFEDISVLKSGMIQLDRGSVLNKPYFIKKIIGKDGYVAMTTEFSNGKINLNFSLSWETFGLDFEISMDHNNSIKYTSTLHNNTNISINKIESLIEESIKNFKKKILNKIENNINDSEFDFRNYKGLLLSLKKKRNNKIGNKTIPNITTAFNNNVISKEFMDFIINNAANSAFIAIFR